MQQAIKWGKTICLLFRIQVFSDLLYLAVIKTYPIPRYLNKGPVWWFFLALAVLETHVFTKKSIETSLFSLFNDLKKLFNIFNNYKPMQLKKTFLMTTFLAFRGISLLGLSQSFAQTSVVIGSNNENQQQLICESKNMRK